MKKLAISIVVCFITIGGLQAQKGIIQSTLQNNYLLQLQNDMDAFKVGDFSSTLNLDSTTIGKLFMDSFISDFEDICTMQKVRINKEIIKSLKISFKKKGRKNKLDWSVRRSYKNVFGLFAKLITDSGVSDAEAKSFLAWYLQQERTETSKVIAALSKQYKKDLKELLTVKSK